MDDWNKKAGLRGLLNSTLEDFAKAPDAPTTSLSELARSEPQGIGLAGVLARHEGIGLADEQPTRLAALARALLAPSPDSEAFVDAAWEKAHRIPGIDACYVRRDRFGASIARYDYGKYTDFGWHLDHIYPKSLGGSDELFNREPLHWTNNLAKSDSVI